MTARESLIERIEHYAGDAIFNTSDCALLLSALRGMQQWIPVGERLPDLCEPVWLLQGDSIWVGERGECEEGEWLWGNCYGDFYWNSTIQKWESSTAEQDDDYQPTKWIPLPTPPAAKPDPNEENSHG